MKFESKTSSFENALKCLPKLPEILSVHLARRSSFTRRHSSMAALSSGLVVVLANKKKRLLILWPTVQQRAIAMPIRAVLIYVLHRTVIAIPMGEATAGSLFEASISSDFLASALDWYTRRAAWARDRTFNTRVRHTSAVAVRTQPSCTLANPTCARFSLRLARPDLTRSDEIIGKHNR